MLSSHRHRPRPRRRIRGLALGLACCALVAPTAALASTDFPRPLDTSAAAAVQVGDTKADIGPAVVLASKVGDTPLDHPGTSGAPRDEAPRTISIVRPGATIMRDVDQALPIALAGTALALALAGLVVALTTAGRVSVARRGH